MITNGDTFAACFGSDPGEDTDIFARQVRYAIRCGYGIHFVEPDTKIRACPLSDRARSAADKAARTAAAEAGKRAPKGHHCAHEPFAVTEASPKAAEQAQRAAKRLAASRGRMNLALDLPASRMVAVDCDTPEQQAAFLDAWSAATGADEAHRSYTVTSPGRRTIAADGTETWVHHGGGHYLFTVPEGVELPYAPGSLTADGGWQLLWTGSVMVPPSRRPEGRYRVVSTVQSLPDWVRERIETAATSAEAERERRLALPEREPGNDIDTYFAGIGWEQLLIPDGWVNGQTVSCGCGTFTAPGEHASPRSATAHEPDCAHLDRPGSGLLHLWTSQPPEYLDGAGRDVSKLTYLAHARHSGSVSDAMRSVGLSPEAGVCEATQLAGAPARALVGEPDQQQREQAGVQTASYHDRLDALAEEVFARPSLAPIADIAATIGTPRWLLLGSVLAELATRHGPHITLPDTMAGNKPPLNLLIGNVGTPGSGKSMSASAGRKVLGSGLDLPRYEIGTPRGMMASFCDPLRRDGSDPQHTDAVQFSSDEVEALAGVMGRHSLSPTLRTAFTGGHLGEKVRDADNDIHVFPGTYRFVLVAGIQPGLSSPVIRDGASGFAARWLLMPAVDAQLSRQPRPRQSWQSLGFTPAPELASAGASYRYVAQPPQPQVINLPEYAEDEIWNRFTRQHAPDATTEDIDAARNGHRLNVQARVAALLALLEHRTKVTGADWELARSVMAVSDIGREMCENALAEQTRQRRQAKADEQVHIDLSRADASQRRHDDDCERVRTRVVEVLRHSPGLKRAEIRSRVSVKLRASFAGVFEEMIEDGEVIGEDVTTEAGQTTRRHWLAE